MIDDELEKLKQEFDKTFDNINIEQNSSGEPDLEEEFKKLFNDIPEQINNNPSITENKKNIEAEDIKEVYVSDANGEISKIFISQNELDWNYVNYNLTYNHNPVYIHDDDSMTIGHIDDEEYTHVNNPNYKYDERLDCYIHKDMIFNPINGCYYKNEKQLNEYGFELKEDIVVAKQNTSDNELFKTYKNYDIITKCLDDIYKDLWDFVPNSMLDNFNSSNSSFHLVIRFPEIKITNSREEFHIIKELYVLIPLILKNKEIYLDGRLYGMRSYLSEKEYTTSYNHSHLPKSSNLFKFNLFCLGSGQIIMSLNNLKANINDTSFFSFLVNLKYYLSWESLEGGPYIKIENLNNTGSEIINDGTCSSANFIRLLKNLDITPIISNNVLDYDFNELEDKITEFLIENELTDYLVNKDYDTNKYYTGVSRSTLKESISSNSSILFKGSFIKGLVEKEVVLSDNNKKVVHPNYTNYVKREWIKRINEGYVTFKRNKEIRKAYGLY